MLCKVKDEHGIVHSVEMEVSSSFVRFVCLPWVSVDLYMSLRKVEQVPATTAASCIECICHEK